MSSPSKKTWVCPVCGYVHEGDEPSDECPVCGALGELFELQTVAQAAQTKAKPTQWRCPICGYIHDGTESPEECPICGSPGDIFEAVEDSEVAFQASSELKKVVIAGAGIAGVSAAEALRKAAPQVEIDLLSREPHIPYYRLNLTRYLAGEITADQLDLYPESWYVEKGINLLRNTELASINLEKKEVVLKNTQRIPFDKLILTVGANPFVPPFQGASRMNVKTLRTRQDVDDILAACQGNKACVCIGGGLLGLETAGALARRGVKVTVLENQPWLLPRQLNEQAARIFEEQVKALGISVRIGAQTKELVGDESVRGVLLEDGILIPADVVIISAGIRSQVSLARQAGLEVKQGILVDDTLQTSHVDVFAAGDVAEHQGMLYGIWGPSQAQGTTAGMNAAGQKIAFVKLPRSNTLKVLGINLFSIGRISPEAGLDQVIEGEIEGKYYCFVFREGHLAGAILLGDTRLASKMKHAVENQADLADLLRKEPGAREVQKYFLENA
jgi:nitrite reductase (NADH) large subunit